MGLIAGFGNFGLHTTLEEIRSAVDLLNAICEDRLDWEHILNRPELYTKSELYNRDEIDDLLADIAPGAHTHEIDDINGLAGQLDGRYTKSETDALLDEKANVEHTHNAAEIAGLADAIRALGIQIVEALPFPVENGKIYAVHPTAAEEFSIFISAADQYIPLNSVTYQALSTAIATRQEKLNGSANELVLGDGTTIPRNKAAVGLDKIPNIEPENWPIPSAQQAINDQKANAAEVLYKEGNQTVNGTLTFQAPPVVPSAISSNQAVNLGQVNALVDDALGNENTWFEVAW